MAFNTDQAKEILERGVQEAQELVKDPSKIDELLGQLQDKLQTIPGVGDLLQNIPLTIALVKSYVAREYTAVSPQVILPLVGAFAYLVKRKDLLSDDIPVLGYADDLAVLGLALKAIEPELKAFEAWRDGQTPMENVADLPAAPAEEDTGVLL